MIDPADKQTQSLPLDEQPAKRKRGRPSTGAAMTPAEKQRAYRERMKANQGGKPGAIYTREEAQEAVRIYQEEIVKLTDELNAAITRAEKAEKANKSNVTKVKRHRDDNSLERIKSAPGDGIWTPRLKVKGSRTWVNCDPQVDFEGVPWSYEDTKKHVQEMQAMQKNVTWQAVRDDGLIYDPKVAK